MFSFCKHKLQMYVFMFSIFYHNAFATTDYQSHIINISLALFARSVQQVMDPRFFPSLFSSIKRRGKKSVDNLPYGPRTRLMRENPEHEMTKEMTPGRRHSKNKEKSSTFFSLGFSLCACFFYQININFHFPLMY